MSTKREIWVRFPIWAFLKMNISFLKTNKLDMKMDEIYVEIELLPSDLPKRKKNRVKNEQYLYKDKIVIWDGTEMRCIHHKRTRYCKDCNGSQICEHKIDKSICKSCGGSQICKHQRDKKKCKDCKGSSRCKPHNRLKVQCIECNGSRICKHKKQKSKCIDCEGSQICEHLIQKAICKKCGGSQICEHEKQKYKCYKCSTHLENFCSECKHVYIRDCKYSPLCYSCYFHLNPDIETPTRLKMKETYIGEYLRDHVDEKFIYDQKIDNGCSKRRPDFRYEKFTHSIVVEVDENQHAYNYNCETKRLMEIFWI